MARGDGLASLEGYPFEVRHSEGAAVRARASADLAADAYRYLSGLLAGVEPDIALIVADRSDWDSRQPYGLPFFNDDQGQIRPGLVVLPADRGEFWVEMGEDIRTTSPAGYHRLLGAYPDGAGGLDLQPFFDLVTIHELGHAFEVLGDLRLPTFWLSEIFANVVLHTFIATRRPESLPILETLPIASVRSRKLTARVRADGFTTLEDLETRYTGGDRPMSPANYVWYQNRWLRIAARMFAADGEAALVRFWQCFRSAHRYEFGAVDRAALATVITSEVSPVLGRAIRRWR